MYAEVILHRRVPGRFESFTYSVPEGFALREGQMVTVPFRKQKLAAVVRRIHASAPAFSTRPIESARAEFLPPWQMELAQWMAAEYGSTLASALRMMMPAGTMEENQGKEKLEKPAGKKESAAMQALLKKIGAAKKPILILEKTPLPKQEFLRACAQAISGQTLFLFPEIFSAKSLGADFPLFHSNIADKQKVAVWHNAAKGALKALAGTRAALFLPFKNLKLIVLDMEENESYREKRKPAFHALEVAEQIAKLLKIPLLITTSAPRVETWYKIKNGEYELVEWNQQIPACLPAVRHGAGMTLIDMKDERLKGNFGIFAENTIESAAGALGQEKQVLLFVNQKGEGGALFCLDCRETARCANCSSPLAVHRGGLLRCHRCKTSQPVPTACAACLSTRLKTLGTGTQKLEDEIKKIFGRANVLRLDQESAVKNRGAPDEKKLKAADIIVATQIIEKPLALPRLSLTVAVSADSLFTSQDFRAGERAWQLLTHLKNLTQESFIIQTMMPDYRLFELFSQNRLEEFYAEELATRRSLSLPPFNGDPSTSSG